MCNRMLVTILMLGLMMVQDGWWHLTGFYGNPKTERRSESWAKLKFLKNSSSLPWLVIGDFNEIIGLSEKKEVV